MDAAAWRGMRDAFLRLWARRHHAPHDKYEGHSSTSGDTATPGGGGGGGGGGVATVTLALEGEGGEAEAEVGVEGGGEGGEGEGGEGEGEAAVCLAQDTLDALIRTRGYVVRDHVPRRVLEHQVMANIRRRERIARILREEEASLALPHATPTPAPAPAPTTRAGADRTQMISLLTKVSTGSERETERES